MTILYKPVLIESAEQAETLPEDTPVLIKADGEAFGLEFARDLLPEHMTPVHHARHYALVPIEAEVETRDHPGIMLPTYPPKYPQQTRLVTPWEEV